MARTAMQARPTLYKGIQMRSRMEAEFAAFLDWSCENRLTGGRWEYEPMCFASERGQYLPDFLLVWEGPVGPIRVYTEVKPFVNDFRSITDRMEIIWESEPAAVLQLVEWKDRGAGGRTWQTSAGAWWTSEGELVLA